VASDARYIAPFAAMIADPEVMRYFAATLTEEQTNAVVEIWRNQSSERGWRIWAAELKLSGEFIRFNGLSISRRPLPCSPCTEWGWRLARRFWGHDSATEGATASLAVGLGQLGLSEIISFTVLANLRSRAVMERIGMRNTGRDFEHPAVPEGTPLHRHCPYAIIRGQWQGSDA